MQQHHTSSSIVESVQTELLDIFWDLSKHEVTNKEKACAQKKLAARRAIEQHFEKKKLEEDICEPWFD